MNQLKVELSRLQEYAGQCLLAAGAEADNAVVTAAFLTQTDAFGIHTHGLKNLAGYLEKARLGALDLTARPVSVVSGPAHLLLDAGSGLGMVSGVAAMKQAIAKAGAVGVATAVVRNGSHFGAAGGYALLAAEAGMIGVVVSNVDRNMTVPGARGPVLGNNPIAYALPAGRYRPVIFDVALSSVASLKVVEARDRGTNVPPGWIVDDRGLPTTDPSGYPEMAAMLPMAGHKGYGFALLVDVLTGLLAGAPTSDQVPSWLFALDRPNQVTSTFIAIDPAAFDGGDFSERAEALLDRIHAVPLADGATEILHPGQLEWRSWERALAEGVTVPAVVRESLERAGERFGIRPPWD